jgi:tetratricopeptide (TPR) repeat protein
VNSGRDMSLEEARRLLERSREVRWRFPSSSGSPVLAEQDAWAKQLLSEKESFAAAARLLSESGDDHEATELAANVWRLWVLARDPLEGRALLAAVLDGREDEPSRAKALALYGDGLLAFMVGAHEDSRARSEASLEAARAVQDPEALALAHLGLSRVAFLDGEYDLARSLAAEAREFARTLEPALGQAPLHMHAQSTRLTGDYDRAAALFEESLALNRRLGDLGMVGVELHNLGHVEIHRGNIDAAERYFVECQELGASDDGFGAAMTRLNRAVVAFARGEDERARALLGDESLLVETDFFQAPDDRFELDWLRERLAEASGTRGVQ